MRTIAVLALCATATAACGGAGFDPPEKIQGLRILAVQKDKPYPKPGDEVTLKLLYWDGKAKEGSPRNVDVEFLPFPCVNPAGDLYYNCYKDLVAGDLIPAAVSPDGGVDASSAPADAGLEVGSMDEGGADAGMALEGGLLPYEADHVKTFTFKVPLQDRKGKPIIHDGQQPGDRYGLVYILFSACAGHVELSAPSVPNGIPILCKNGNETLGPDDFVPGYTSIYVYDDRPNENPKLRDLLFNGDPTLGSPGKSDDQLKHIPRCVPGSACATYTIKVDFEMAHIAEIDPGSTDINGNKLDEQMWAAYYTTGGTFDHPLRLVNDASQHWNEDNGSNFTAPAEPGPVRLWAVVHDNRGGVAWVESKIFVD